MMTLVVSDYPRKQVGRIAEINGMTVADGPWIAVREALDIIGVRAGVLVRWEEEGLISVVQAFMRSPRRYLKPELEIVAKLGDDGPPNLRTLRRYLNTQPGHEREGRLAGSPQETDPQQESVPRPNGSEGAEFVVTLAKLLREQKLSTEMVGERRVRVTKNAGSRGVTVECRRRASDSDRWWFSWGGGVWLCEADNPTEAVVQVKAALRTVRGPR